MGDLPRKLGMPTPLSDKAISDDIHWTMEQFREWVAYREQCIMEARECDRQIARLQSEVVRRVKEAERAGEGE